MYKVKVYTIRGNLKEEHEHIVSHIVRLENGAYAFIAGDRQEGRRWEYSREFFMGFEQEPLDIV